MIRSLVKGMCPADFTCVLPSKALLVLTTSRTVRARSPHADRLVTALTRRGVTVELDDDGVVIASDVDTPQIGEIAAAEGLVLHELVQETDSLEQAFLRFTEHAADYHSEVKP